MANRREYTNARNETSAGLRTRVVAIVGPTASGKTDVALRLAERFSGEIIAADSRQVYEGMDIGTNKAVGRWQRVDGKRTYVVEGIPYHGIDLVEPDETFTVQRWKEYAQKKIQEIVSRGHLPIIEGGTGLYVWALLDNLTIPEVPPDPALRKHIECRIRKEGIEKVVEEILDADPDAATFLDVRNPRRVVRAYEVITATALPLSQQRTRGPKPYDDLRLGIAVPLGQLDRRIAKRAREQFDAGLETEVRTLAERFGWGVPAMSGIGYAEWRPYLSPEGEHPTITRDAVFAENIRRNKKCARVQRKWFRRDPKIHWVSSRGEAAQKVEKFLAAARK